MRDLFGTKIDENEVGRIASFDFPMKVEDIVLQVDEGLKVSEVFNALDKIALVITCANAKYTVQLNSLPIMPVFQSPSNQMELLPCGAIGGIEQPIAPCCDGEIQT